MPESIFKKHISLLLLLLFFLVSCQHNGQAGKEEGVSSGENNEINQLKKQLREYPDSLMLRFQLAKALREKGEERAALKQIDTMIMTDSGSSGLHLIKGELLLQEKDTTSAISAYEKAYELEPASNAQYSLAYLYASSGDARALSLSDSMILHMTKNHPRGDPFFIKGIYHLRKGDETQAMRSFNQSINIDHTFMEAYMEKGKILFRNQEYDQAEKVFRLAATVSNSFPDAYFWTGKCLEEKGENRLAMQEYKKALALEPAYNEARKALNKLSN